MIMAFLSAFCMALTGVSVGKGGVVNTSPQAQICTQKNKEACTKLLSDSIIKSMREPASTSRKPISFEVEEDSDEFATPEEFKPCKMGVNCKS